MKTLTKSFNKAKNKIFMNKTIIKAHKAYKKFLLLPILKNHQYYSNLSILQIMFLSMNKTKENLNNIKRSFCKNIIFKNQIKRKDIYRILMAVAVEGSYSVQWMLIKNLLELLNTMKIC